MNSLLILLMLRALAAGPLADCYWLVATEEIVRMIESGEPVIMGSSGLRARYSIEEGKERFVLNCGYNGNAGIAGYNFQIRIDRRGDRESSGIGSALEFGVGGWRMSLGPARGGMGAGLMVGERLWNSSGAGVRSAWAGIPTRLRTGPTSAEYPRPQAVSLHFAGQPEATLSFVRKVVGEDFLLAELRPSETMRAVLLHSEEQRGFEASIGNRGGTVEWRISGAAWNGGSAGDGGSVEFLASSRSGVAGWGLRFWSWLGSEPPLAPPPQGATASRRLGGRMSIDVKPFENVKLAASLESAFDRERNPESLWWRSQLQLVYGRAASAGLQLRLQNTDQLEREPWLAWSHDTRSLVDIKMRSAAARIRWHGGFRKQREGSTSPSCGIWIEVESVDQKWVKYVRALYSRPSAGLPLYWFEPGPAYGWNLHTETRRGMRLLFGLHNREGFHVQLIARNSRLSGLKTSWFHAFD